MVKSLSGEQLDSTFKAYLAECIRINRRKATTDEINWFGMRFLKFVGDKELSFEVIQNYLDTLLTTGTKGKAWKTSSVKGDFKMIKKVVNWMIKRKYLDSDFSLQDILIPEEDEDGDLDLADLPSIKVAQEIIKLATEIPPNAGKGEVFAKKEKLAAFNFMLRTGIRIKEASKMKGSDLMLDAETPSYVVRGAVSKTRKGVVLPLCKAQDMMDELRARKNNERLFVVNKKTTNTALKEGCERFGWKGKQITNHSLRHIFACNCAKNGMPVAELARLMRHKSIEITNKYYLHYNVKELSASVHQYNDLMKKSQTIKEIMEQARQAFEKSGILFDDRFDYLPEISSKGMTLKIMVK